jgi:hypothetical protein
VGLFYDLLLDHVKDKWDQDAIQIVLNSVRDMANLHQDTAQGHALTLNGLPTQGQSGAYLEFLGTVPPVLNQNALASYDVIAEAERVAANATAQTAEAATAAEGELDADVAVSTFVDTFIGPIGWLISTLIEIGLGIAIIYQFVEIVERLVQEFERLFPSTPPQRQPVPTKTPPTAPTNALTPDQVHQRDELATEFATLISSGAITIDDIGFLLEQGYTPAQIRALLRNWAKLNSGTYVDRNGVTHRCKTLRQLLTDAEKKDKGALRELYALMDVGPSAVAGIDVQFSVTVAGTVQAGAADLVLTDGTIVEVGGSTKAQTIADQAAKYREFLKETGGSQIWLYLDDNGKESAAFRRAKRRAQEIPPGSPPGTLPPVDRIIQFTLPGTAP